MQTIEEMHKDFEENPEHKKMTENQMKYFFPKWVAEKNKEKILNNIPDDDKKILFQCILLGNITEEEIQQSLLSSNFIQTEKLLNDLINGNDKVIDQLHEMYINNVNAAKTEYEQKILDLKYTYLPKAQKEQVDRLRDNGQNDKVKVIINNYDKYGEKIKKVETGYNIFCRWVDLFDVYQFNADVLKVNKDLILELAYAVNSPTFLMPAYVDVILSKKEEPPSSWYLYRKLTMAEYKNLLSKGNNQQTWNDLFNLVGNSILNKADIPILPIIKRKDLLNSIMTNFQNKYYDSAMIIAFSVIEGLLWELSYEVNKKEKVYGDNVAIMYDCKKKEEFQSNRIRDVIERTAVKKYLDPEFIKEFCKELYEERNPVIHGNSVCHYECKKLGMCFIKKLFVLDYLLNTIEEVYQKTLFDMWDKSFDSKKANEFIEIFYKKRKCLNPNSSNN